MESSIPCETDCKVLVTNIATRTKGERMVNNVIICNLRVAYNKFTGDDDNAKY